ncbi:MAG: TrmH family RNA methyltransferase [Candidatus Taylorbacteria bacterium]|nr:TrmH family RNA methyltransferase [Candidatus Taylorbacteria bacterium]
MVYLILHNIRSVYNVGAIFRTADAICISKIYLTGYTPAPLDRFGRERKDIAKVSLGAEKTVVWEARKSLPALLRKLRKEGVAIIAVEQDAHSVDYKKIKIRKPTAFIFGNEVGGISKNILTLSDTIAEIPMRGEKESLNVSVSAGIVLFRLLDR